MKEIYLDHAATTNLHPDVLNKMLPYMKNQYGNPSSIYSLGRKARIAIEYARDDIAKIFNCTSEEIYFTSCGSESDNLAIRGICAANKDKGNHIITSKIEHPAVLETCKTLEKEGYKVTYLNIKENGIIDLEELENSITKDTILITIMFANNEIGTIQPIKEIGNIAKKHNIIFHTDAVQATGTIRINVKEFNISAMSFSAHKFYGPKGVGALYIKNGIKFNKIQTGGHQEKNKRAGTENVSGIIGMAEALKLAYNNLEKNNEHLYNLREKYITLVEKNIPYIKLNGDRYKRLPGNANISFRFIEGESLLLNLDNNNIFASSGSACTSGSLDPSHVLLALGLTNELAHGSLRVTFGNENTEEDVEFLVKILIESVEKLRKKSPLYENFIKQTN